MEQIPTIVDILKPRNTQFGILKFMSRSWDPMKTMTLDRNYKPQELKNIVATSTYMDSFLESESKRRGIPKLHLKREVNKYLDEIAMDKKMHVIRWMGVVFLKITFMMKIGMFVDETPVFKLKEQLGKNPVLLLPTHRSYADFCLLTYLCYHYDIELPAVAAGMDFYSMAVVGQSMRETGAFYMRRTLIGAPLYAATLRQYVRALVAKHDAPVEFFLEGTRSRSNKSLTPKYGMLSMSLVPYFAREVPDVTVVPINISYDRLMEQSLFAHEHLGVPKPKETTGGLLKSISKLNDYYGNIYIKFGDPISLKEYLGNEGVSPETLLPLDLQNLNNEQAKKVQKIAEHVVEIQQSCTVVTITNLLSIVLMDSLLQNEPLTLDQAVEEMEWLIGVLRGSGATVFENDVRNSIDRILVVHKSMIRVERNRLRLLSSARMAVGEEVQKKMKGHILKAETMVNAIPIIQLQLYVNPVLHYLVPPALVFLLVSGGSTATDILRSQFCQIRRLLRHEIFYVEKDEQKMFDEAMMSCEQMKAISKGKEIQDGNGRAARLLRWAALAPLCTLRNAAEVMAEEGQCEHKLALKLIQQRAEERREHPYCLSLDAAANCLQGLLHAGALVRHRRQEDVVYEAVPEVLQKNTDLVNSVLPKMQIDFDEANSVLVSQKLLSSKL